MYDSCKNSKKKVVVTNQKLLYDSTQTNNKYFKVTLITTMKLNSNIEDESLKNFYIVATKDTLPLNMKKRSKNIVEYSTLLKQEVKDFEDSNFVGNVENYKIKNKNSNIFVIKSPDYSISTLMRLWQNHDKNKVQ